MTQIRKLVRATRRRGRRRGSSNTFGGSKRALRSAVARAVEEGSSAPVEQLVDSMEVIDQYSFFGKAKKKAKRYGKKTKSYGRKAYSKGKKTASKLAKKTYKAGKKMAQKTFRKPKPKQTGSRSKVAPAASPKAPVSAAVPRNVVGSRTPSVRLMPKKLGEPEVCGTGMYWKTFMLAQEAVSLVELRITQAFNNAVVGALTINPLSQIRSISLNALGQSIPIAQITDGRQAKLSNCLPHVVKQMNQEVLAFASESIDIQGLAAGQVVESKVRLFTMSPKALDSIRVDLQNIVWDLAGSNNITCVSRTISVATYGDPDPAVVKQTGKYAKAVNSVNLRLAGGGMVGIRAMLAGTAIAIDPTTFVVEIDGRPLTTAEWTEKVEFWERSVQAIPGQSAYSADEVGLEFGESTTVKITATASSDYYVWSVGGTMDAFDLGDHMDVVLQESI